MRPQSINCGNTMPPEHVHTMQSSCGFNEAAVYQLRKSNERENGSYPIQDLRASMRPQSINCGNGRRSIGQPAWSDASMRPQSINGGN